MATILAFRRSRPQGHRVRAPQRRTQRQGGRDRHHEEHDERRRHRIAAGHREHAARRQPTRMRRSVRRFSTKCRPIATSDQNRRLGVLQRELAHRERLSAIGKMSSVVSHQILQQLGPARGRGRRGRGELRAGRPGTRRHAPVGRPLAPPAAARQAQDPPGPRQRAAQRHRGLAPRAEVAVHALGGRDGVELRVTDHGPGVPPGERDAVFAPFFTTKDQGTGLGLAIAREFARAHGGDLRLAESDGAGTTFVLRLPCGAAASPSRAGHAR
jgi:C4-dicarboxylate-specific signal transduction histidine kinase